MVTKYNAVVNNEVIIQNLHRLIGQIYKLLPYREEGLDWEKPLHTIQVELVGLHLLFVDHSKFHQTLLALECKLEALTSEMVKNDFEYFRRTIFECIGKIKVLQDICKDLTT